MTYEPAMSADIAGLWAAVLDSPGDAGLKLVLADACAEAGDEVTERALRWCVREGKWPNWRGGPADRWAATRFHTNELTLYGWGWFGQSGLWSLDDSQAKNTEYVLPFDVWCWFRFKGRGSPEQYRRTWKPSEMGSNPFPECRHETIETVIYRLGLALAWAKVE